MASPKWQQLFRPARSTIPLAATTETFPEIPFFDLKVEQEDVDAVAETLRSGWLTMGPRTADFERAFADYVGTKHAVAVSSCTAALHLAYLAAGVGPGDEVIVPAFTFAATAAAVIFCGATPVFALIEDAAHGPGGYLKDKHIGTYGLAGCFSFFSNKVLSVGEGGMLGTDDDDVAELANRLRCYGMTSGTWARHSKSTTTYDVTGLGYNYKLD